MYVCVYVYECKQKSYKRNYILPSVASASPGAPRPAPSTKGLYRLHPRVPAARGQCPCLCIFAERWSPSPYFFRAPSPARTKAIMRCKHRPSFRVTIAVYLMF